MYDDAPSSSIGSIEPSRSMAREARCVGCVSGRILLNRRLSSLLLELGTRLITTFCWSRHYSSPQASTFYETWKSSRERSMKRVHVFMNSFHEKNAQRRSAACKCELVWKYEKSSRFRSASLSGLQVWIRMESQPTNINSPHHESDWNLQKI